MTYFKRAERDAADQIDWGAISKGIVESISTEKKAREEKRTQIDKESADIFREISDSPASPRADLTSFTVNFSSQAQDMMRTLNTELKAGNLTLADYTLKKQNLLTSTKQMYGMISGWGKVVSANMERINNGLESNVGIAAKAFVEKAGDFDKSQAYIDPATGNVVVAPKGLKPEEIAANASNIKDMFAALNQNIDKVDFKANLKKMADGVENQIYKEASQSDKTGRSRAEIIDKTKASPAYKKYIETVVGGILNDPMASAKYLMDELPAKDGPWEATSSQDEANKNPGRYVFYQKGPTGYAPVLNEAQKAMVKTSIEQSVDAMIGTSTGKETADNVSIYERDAMERARIQENKKESVSEKKARLSAEDESLLTFEQRRAIERRITKLSASFLRDVVGPLLGKQSGTTGINTLNESSLLKMSNKKLLEVAALIESNTRKFGQSSLVGTDTGFLPEAIAKAGRMSSDSEGQSTGRATGGKTIEGF
jgi:hypothetical protein